jgi:hypothetical protein
MATKHDRALASFLVGLDDVAHSVFVVDTVARTPDFSVTLRCDAETKERGTLG